jgi:hypothetical protein
MIDACFIFCHAFFEFRAPIKEIDCGINACEEK